MFKFKNTQKGAREMAIERTRVQLVVAMSGDSQTLQILVPGNLTPSSGFHGHCTHLHTETHTFIDFF